MGLAGGNDAPHRLAVQLDPQQHPRAREGVAAPLAQGFEHAQPGRLVAEDRRAAAAQEVVDVLVLAVPNAYKYKSSGRLATSNDYEKTVSVAETLYSHSRFDLPYRLVVIGY